MGPRMIREDAMNNTSDNRNYGEETQFNPERECGNDTQNNQNCKKLQKRVWITYLYRYCRNVHCSINNESWHVPCYVPGNRYHPSIYELRWIFNACPLYFNGLRPRN